MKLLNFAVINLTICLICGICIAEFSDITLNGSLWLTIVLLLVLSISYLILRNTFTKTYFFTAISFFATISVGILIHNLNDQRNYPSHYSHLQISESSLLTLEVIEILKPTTFYTKYVAILREFNNQPVSGKLLLNVQKNFKSKVLPVGSVVVTTQGIDRLSTPLNPYQFDYAHFLNKRNIYNQISAAPKELLQIDRQNSLYSIAANFRNRINVGLKNLELAPDEIAVINALLLGQRQDLDASIYNNYVNAGAVHILAVSGLHVGIIWMILTFLLKPLRYFKYGKFITGGIIVIFLWVFALIAGLSPSVTRAVMMFSIITVANLLNRPTNIYNTLAASAFFILIYNPMFLFEVGFQMSYLAVLGIVTFRPAIIKLYQPKKKAFLYIYNLLLVTFGAQLGVLPISLFYFHQFPSLFFLSNLLIIPAMSLILGFGLIVIFLAYLNITSNLFVDVYGYIIHMLNELVAWISLQEGFLLEDISFNFQNMIASYLVIFGLLLLLSKRLMKHLVFFVISLVILQATIVFGDTFAEKNDLIVFHKSRESLVVQKHHDSLALFSSIDPKKIKEDWLITNYKIGSFTNQITAEGLKPLYTYKDHILLVVDSLSIYNIKSLKPDYVLMTHSPKINLSRLIDSVKPNLVIADGSNYKSYIQRWKETCEKKQISFHATGTSGALLFSKIDQIKKP